MVETIFGMPTALAIGLGANLAVGSANLGMSIKNNMDMQRMAKDVIDMKRDTMRMMGNGYPQIQMQQMQNQMNQMQQMMQSNNGGYFGGGYNNWNNNYNNYPCGNNCNNWNNNYPYGNGGNGGYNNFPY